MKTRIFIGLLGLVIALNTYSQTVVIRDGIRYLIEDGVAVVGRQNIELAGEIVIPSYITYNNKDYTVTRMVEPTNLTAWSNNTVTTEGGAFQSCAITSIELPSTITVIPAGAFSGCRNLSKVSLPESLTAIGGAAFSDCTSLENLDIPESVKEFGSYSQYGMVSYTFGGSAVKTIHIPSGVTRLVDGCFLHSSLDSIYIPNTITQIGDDALNAPHLRIVKMGIANLSALSYSTICFGPSDMSSTDLYVPNGSIAVYKEYHPWSKFRSITEYGEPGEVYEPDKINIVYNDINYTLKDNIAIISRQSKELSGTIIIPDSIPFGDQQYPVTQMEGAIDLTCYSSNTIECVGGAFQGSAIDTIVLPSTLSYIAEGAFQNCYQLKKVVLSENTTRLGAASFAGCHNLVDINLHDNITDLASRTEYGYRSYVFGGCVSLKNIIVPSKVTQLASGCFQHSGIETITIPAGCKILDEGCLNTNTIRVLTLGARDMYELSFSESSLHTDVPDTLYVPKGSKQVYEQYYPWMNSEIVEYDDGLGEYVPTKITTKIDGIRYVLENRTATVGRQDKNLSGDIIIPDSVLYRDNYYLVNAITSPTDITAWSSNRVTTENGAFQSCPITSITIPNTITTIPAGAFYACTELDSVILPEGLLQLGAACFAECRQLKEIQIPESVTDFGSYTQYGYKSFIFGNCTSLKKVNIPKAVTKFTEGCFKGSGLEIFIIPSNVTRLEEDCFAVNGMKAIKITHEVLNNLTYTQSVFSNVSQTSLYVPQGTASTYAQFYPWKNFKEIVEYVDQDDEFDFNAYSVTYLINEGPSSIVARRYSALDSDIYKKTYSASGVKLAEIEAPVIAGKTFIGWEGIPDVMPSNNIILKAMFQESTTDNGIITENKTEDISKILRNGNIYINKGGKLYTLSGSQVK